MRRENNDGRKKPDGGKNTVSRSPAEDVESEESAEGLNCGEEDWKRWG